MVEISIHTEGEESTVLAKSLSTQTEDQQDIITVAQSDKMIAPTQESAISIQIIIFCNYDVGTTIQQGDQRVLFFENMISGSVLQSQQQEPQFTMT